MVEPSSNLSNPEIQQDLNLFYIAIDTGDFSLLSFVFVPTATTNLTNS